MKKQYIIYAIISTICVIAIGCGVYYEMFMREDDFRYQPQNNVANNIGGGNTLDPSQSREEFNSLFKNFINFQNFSVNNITKLDETKEIVFTAYDVQYEEEKYSMDIKIPWVNIANETVADFNNITQQVFIDKANEILLNAKEYTIYNIDYIAFINNNILSLAIKSSLKEGNGAQRIIVQTYNYNLETGEKVTLNELLDSKNINKNSVNKKIEEEVTQASKEADALSEALGQMGQAIYKRDLNSAIYITDNVRNFLYGKDGTIYIVYAYGNTSETSEIDIIKVN